MTVPCVAVHLVTYNGSPNYLNTSLHFNVFCVSEMVTNAFRRECFAGGEHVQAWNYL